MTRSAPAIASRTALASVMSPRTRSTPRPASGDQPVAAILRADVERCHVSALTEQGSHHPGTQTSVGAGNEETLSHYIPSARGALEAMIGRQLQPSSGLLDREGTLNPLTAVPCLEVLAEEDDIAAVLLDDLLESLRSLLCLALGVKSKIYVGMPDRNQRSPIIVDHSQFNIDGIPDPHACVSYRRLVIILRIQLGGLLRGYLRGPVARQFPVVARSWSEYTTVDRAVSGQVLQLDLSVDDLVIILDRFLAIE